MMTKGTTGTEKVILQVLRYCLTAFIVCVVVEGIYNRIKNDDRNYIATALGIGAVCALVFYRPDSSEENNTGSRTVKDKSVEPSSHSSTTLLPRTPQRIHRPYIKCYVDKLESIAEANLNNTDVLTELHHELGFRSRKKASVLRTKIAKRLAQTQKPSFKWPNTDINPGSQRLPKDIFRNEEGLLSEYGYKVGAQGLSRIERIDILNAIFLHPLVPMKNSTYLQEWGDPRTAQRLRKLANSIAAFARNAKRRSGVDFSRAIQDWESDLAYLKRRYYDDFFSFRWPST